MPNQSVSRSGVVIASLALLLGACGTGNDQGVTTGTGTRSGGTVTILGTLTGVGQEKLEQAIAPFTQATGIEVVYEGTDAFATLLPVRVEAGNVPDIALFPQPGLMADLAREGQLVPIDTFIEPQQLSEYYTQDWLDLGSVDGKVYGIWIRADLKSLVWYSPAAFAAAGYAIPTTWDEMLALSDQIVADGGVPWCLGLESGDATGWVGTDWIEDIMLRTAGPDVYDQWVRHEIPFNAPVVKTAFEQFGKIALNPDYVVGGAVGVISTPFGDAPTPLFDQPPGCYLHRQASFITAFLPDAVELGQDVDIFPLPAMTAQSGLPILVGGIVFGMLNDTPATQALMAYLATPQPHTIWAGLGSYISPHKQVSLDAYPDAITRRQAEILANAEVLRFDGSDLMPGAVGTGTFWTGMIDYVGGNDIDTILAEIEDSWPEENN
ncbi:MAG: carbohydrate ABC transporter substrate-binding protein [Cyanothece sp. SIO1E1]|nr:carbohydrate ABC transporter substrate-binding protein [Cyanothece sp. SIO1E1]